MVEVFLSSSSDIWSAWAVAASNDATCSPFPRNRRLASTRKLIQAYVIVVYLPSSIITNIFRYFRVWDFSKMVYKVSWWNRVVFDFKVEFLPTKTRCVDVIALNQSKLISWIDILWLIELQALIRQFPQWFFFITLNSVCNISSVSPLFVISLVPT